ncbi:hypothetical protein ACIA5C_08525 [Actinoplanes sp. NPDC051343]|uniref:hypothetical protein n=1 Tax=Actinoplanes sp. NPDC051343 TaxID=3363906 RepID=UPI0037BA962C
MTELHESQRGQLIFLDHYLEALLRKPGALPGSTVLELARAAASSPPSARMPAPGSERAGRGGAGLRSCG